MLQPRRKVKLVYDVRCVYLYLTQEELGSSHSVPSLVT